MKKKQEEQQRPSPDSRALPTTINFEQDAKKGMEGADRDSYAIPFLVVLQPLSPQVDDVPNAKAGMLLNSVTNALYPEAVIVPCVFQRRWVRWGAREAGGGFKGELTTAQVNELREKGTVKELEGRLYYPESDGSVNPKKSDRLADTRNHYCLVLPAGAGEDELPVAMVFALASTGIKVSKNLMSRIDSIKLRGEGGKTFTPPSFSHLYSVKTEQKTNEKGKWWQPTIEMIGPVRSQALYAQAKAFHTQIMEGRVDLATESLRPEREADDRM